MHVEGPKMLENQGPFWPLTFYVWAVHVKVMDNPGIVHIEQRNT